MGNNHRIARKISTLAGKQWGHVTRAQLLELGLSPSMVDRRIAKGELIRVHAGVYAVGHPRPEARARAAAAVLACGPGAVLSHASAAALWGITERWPDTPEVTVPTDRRRPGIRIHRCTTLGGQDIRRHQGIESTSPAQTLRDIASRLTDARLARALNDARLNAGLQIAALQELLQRKPHRRLQALVSDEAPTRSVFEDAFLAFAQRHRLPRPRVNARVAGYEVDIVFEAERVIVELDGYRHHAHHAAFERDRERDAHTLAAGYVTIRITWRRLVHGAQREAVRLRAILEERRSVLLRTPSIPLAS